MEASVFEGRYARNFNTFSRDEQNRLGRSCVAVIGLGGLGGGVCEMLARVGVERLVLIDGDRFEVSNLNRQLLCEERLIGTSKAEAAAERVRAVNSEIRVTHISRFLDETDFYDHIRGADVVMDCLDAIDTRFQLQGAARKAGIPIVSGAIAGLTGQVTTIFPEDVGYGLIYGEKSREQARGVETRTGNIAYCALLVAALQASECVKILLNRGELLRNKLLVAELWTNTLDVMDLV